MLIFRKHIKGAYLWMAPSFTILLLTASCAPQQQKTPQSVSIVRETRADVDNLQHEVNSYSSQIQILEDRIGQQENALTALRQQQADSSQANQDALKQKWPALDKRLASLEKTQESLSADLRQLKTNANDTTSSLAQFKAKQSDLEQRLDKNVSSLKAAIESLMDALQQKGTAAKQSSKDNDKNAAAYKVKAGDSLERIAKANQTTVEKLKNTNQLKSDVIFVGQQLTLPVENDG